MKSLYEELNEIDDDESLNLTEFSDDEILEKLWYIATGKPLDKNSKAKVSKLTNGNTSFVIKVYRGDGHGSPTSDPSTLEFCKSTETKFREFIEKETDRKIVKLKSGIQYYEGPRFYTYEYATFTLHVE